MYRWFNSSLTLMVVGLFFFTDSWASCDVFTRSLNWDGSQCQDLSDVYSRQRPSGCNTKLDGTCGVDYCCDVLSCSGSYPLTIKFNRCSTLAELDSLKCVNFPQDPSCVNQDSIACLERGWSWQNGKCIDTTACNTYITECTNSYGSSHYTITDESKCIGYCDSVRITTTRVSPVVQTRTILVKSAYDSTTYYKVDCTGTCDIDSRDSTILGYDVEPEHCTMDVSSDIYHLTMEECNYIDSLASIDHVVHQYRGTKGGKYVYWYSNQPVPSGVTNVVRMY